MNKKAKIGVTLATVLAFSVLILQAQTSASTFGVSPQEAKQLLDSGKIDLVVDVRTPGEYIGPYGHIQGAKLLPIQNMPSQLKAIESFKDKTVLVYCHSGGRSAKSASIMQANGFKKVYDLKEGIMGWKAKGFPTENRVSQN